MNEMDGCRRISWSGMNPDPESQKFDSIPLEIVFPRDHASFRNVISKIDVRSTD